GVDVRGPGVEGRERDLESEPDEEKEESHGDDGVGREARVPETFDPDAAALSEEERDAVEREGRREGTRQEVLQTGLGRGVDLPKEAGQDVQREGQELEADEHEQEVEPSRHEQGADLRPQQQRVELALLLAVAPQVARRDKDRDAGRPLQEDPEDGRQGGGLVAAAEGRAGRGGEEEPERGGERRERKGREGASRPRQEGV